MEHKQNQHEEPDFALKPGDNDPLIGICQQNLVELGYNIKLTDGFYGPDTTEAVQQFQHKHKFTPTGVITISEFTSINKELFFKKAEHELNASITIYVCWTNITKIGILHKWFILCEQKENDKVVKRKFYHYGSKGPNNEELEDENFQKQELCVTSKSFEDIDDVVKGLYSYDFTKEEYRLITNNSQNFTKEFAKRLYAGKDKVLKSQTEVVVNIAASAISFFIPQMKEVLSICKVACGVFKFLKNKINKIKEGKKTMEPSIGTKCCCICI